jgi:hypothetical protein
VTGETSDDVLFTATMTSWPSASGTTAAETAAGPPSPSEIVQLSVWNCSVPQPPKNTIVDVPEPMNWNVPACGALHANVASRKWGASPHSDENTLASSDDSAVNFPS